MYSVAEFNSFCAIKSHDISAFIRIAQINDFVILNAYQQYENQLCLVFYFN